MGRLQDVVKVWDPYRLLDSLCSQPSIRFTAHWSHQTRTLLAVQLRQSARSIPDSLTIALSLRATVDMAPATECALGVCWRGDRVVRWERPLCGGNAHSAGIRSGVSCAGGGWHCRRTLSELTVLRKHRRLRRRKVSPPHITPRSAPASPPAGGALGSLGRRGPAPGSTSRLPPVRPLRPVDGPIAPKLPVDGPTG